LAANQSSAKAAMVFWLAQCSRSGSFGPGFGLDNGGIDALGDQALPLAGCAPRFSRLIAP
jgi:hypothetical protein